MKEKFVAILKEKYENVDNIIFSGYNMHFLCASPRLSETFIVTGELIEKIQKAIENSIIVNWKWTYKIGMFSAGSSYRNRLFYIIILENIDDVDINIYLCDIKRELEVLPKKESISIGGLLLLGTK